MRDNFYHWLAVSLMFAFGFGAFAARALDGNLDLFNLAAYGGISALATAGTISSYRRDRGAAPAHPGEGEKNGDA